VSQTDVAPTQRVVFVAEHWPHAPVAWQAGVAPPQSTSAAQARHVCVGALQVGVAPLQLALVRQATQVPAGTLHTGVAPPQADVFVAEHAPQAPVGWHAGAPGPHSASTAHVRHACVVPSQMGVPPPQSAAATQPTHVPVDV
jgi:hypothetical protein